MADKFMQRVLVPYKITLLSNSRVVFILTMFVLVPYKITLLSNSKDSQRKKSNVLVPYKITLLSNMLCFNATLRKF